MKFHLKYLVAFIGLVLVACYDPISYGKVYNKEFQPHREWIEEVQYCNNITIGSISIPTCRTENEQRQTPDMWFIDIQGEDDNGKFQQRRIRVTEDLYNTTKIGETFSVPGEADD